MRRSKPEASTLDYPALVDLARSRNVRVVEARGLDTRKGVRFRKNGSEWMAMASDLSISEKTRTLGYLLENDPVTVMAKVGVRMGWFGSNPMNPVLTLCCSSD